MDPQYISQAKPMHRASSGIRDATLREGMHKIEGKVRRAGKGGCWVERRGEARWVRGGCN